MLKGAFKIILFTAPVIAIFGAVAFFMTRQQQTEMKIDQAKFQQEWSAQAEAFDYDWYMRKAAKAERDGDTVRAAELRAQAEKLRAQHAAVAAEAKATEAEQKRELVARKATVDQIDGDMKQGFKEMEQELDKTDFSALKKELVEKQK